MFPAVAVADAATPRRQRHPSPARPRVQAVPRRPHRRLPPATSMTISPRPSSTPPSTTSPSPTSSCTATSCCSSSPATRRRATPSPAACTPCSSTLTSGRRLAADPVGRRDGDRGDPALDVAGRAVRPHGDGRCRARAGRRSRPATRSRSGTRRRTATSGSSTTRTASTSAATRTTTSRSASASTSASAPTSPAGSCGPSFASWPCTSPRSRPSVRAPPPRPPRAGDPRVPCPVGGAVTPSGCC